MARFIRWALIAALCGPLAGCYEHDANLLGYIGLAKPRSNIGDAGKGLAIIAMRGCKACHTIPGVAGANGNVGPPLTRMGSRSYIAGVLPNSPDNMMTWVRAPQSVVPGNAMPNIDMSDEDARDVAAYLYTLR